MPELDVLTAPAPAKVNLVLEVTGVRPDGYHEIDTILQTLELADTVTISRGDRDGVAVEGPFATGTPADETNLAWGAATALAQRCGRSVEGLGISLRKEIPAAGGLGGGASDAATTLRLLQRWWPEATEAHVRAAAAEVGSDEAFFLVGGTARARGRGEQVTPLPPFERQAVVLFVPPATIERKTARMFAALDQHPFDEGAVVEKFVREFSRSIRAADVYNAFERVAFDVFDGLGALWETLEQRAGVPVRLAGAGPTLFWIGTERDAAHVAGAAAGTPCTAISTFTAESLWRR